MACSAEMFQSIGPFDDDAESMSNCSVLAEFGTSSSIEHQIAASDSASGMPPSGKVVKSLNEKLSSPGKGSGSNT
jgi:hypothetical protein